MTHFCKKRDLKKWQVPNERQTMQKFHCKPTKPLTFFCRKQNQQPKVCHLVRTTSIPSLSIFLGAGGGRPFLNGAALDSRSKDVFTSIILSGDGSHLLWREPYCNFVLGTKMHPSLNRPGWPRRCRRLCAHNIEWSISKHSLRSWIRPTNNGERGQVRGAIWWSVLTYKTPIVWEYPSLPSLSPTKGFPWKGGVHSGCLTSFTKESEWGVSEGREWSLMALRHPRLVPHTAFSNRLRSSGSLALWFR